jgi:cytochrome P450
MNKHIESVYDTESESVYADAKSVPALRGLPGIGVALQLHRNAIEFFSDTVKRYGDRVELRVFGRHVLLLTNPADVNDVLIRKAADFGRSTEVKSLRPVFGDGIYSSEGERWRKQRRVVQPAFNHDRIVQYTSTMVERMTDRASKWRHGETLDVLKEMIAFTTDVICEVLFGQEQDSDVKAIANSVSGVFENLRAEILYLSLWQKLPFPRSRRWCRAVKTLDAAINNIIAERRSGSAEKEDLLGLLLRAKDENGEEISNEDAHDEVITMFVTGQETSAVALSWAIALLAQHSEFQEEAAAEIAQVTNGRDVMAEDYPRLKFLNAVVHETLRLYPPLWTIGRSTIRDTTLGGDLPVRSGTEVWIPIQQIHRDARWFPAPGRFNPYRWDEGIRKPKVGYFPFGGGPRRCVAQHFAMAELVLGLAVMLSQFRFRLAPEAKVEMDAWLTLRPRNGVPVVVSAR